MKGVSSSDNKENIKLKVLYESVIDRLIQQEEVG